MSDASIWRPGSDVPLVTNEVNVYQAFVATAAQTVFTLTDFVYVPASDAMRVTVNGVAQIPGRDFTETSGTVVTLAFAADVDDDVVLWGVAGASYSTAATLAAASAAAAAASAVLAAGYATDLSNGTIAFTTPALGAATGTSLVLSGLLTVGGAFTSLGLDDNATAKALTLSGSGANSVTIANSATNPTIGTSGGSLALSSVINYIGTGSTDYCALYGGTGAFTIQATGGSANVALQLIAKGTGAITFGNLTETQVAVTNTASANRYLTLTGSNGGNPTIGTSGGNLAIAVPLVVAGTAGINTSQAPVAGGVVGVYMGTTSIGIFFGSGAPTVAAAKGSIYLRSDGSATNNRMYVNTDGGTTWTAVTTAA